MKRKTIMYAGLAATIALSLSACGGGTQGESASSSESGASNSGDTGGAIDFFFNAPTGSPQDGVMRELISEFEEESNVKVNLTIASSSYEDDMKVLMASGDIPDVFATHGWSVLRYGPFLTPLQDEPWAENLNSGLENVMLDNDGNLYALPLEYGIAGMVANFDVLEEHGIDPDSLASWDGFNAAAAKLADADITVVTSAGADSNSGDVGNFMASGAFTQDENTSFLDGEFSTDLWESGVTNHIQEWADKGWMNPDYVSATYDDMARQLADGSAAFAYSWPFVAQTALEFNSGANLGFIPFPGPEPYLVGGEGVSSFGVAKDSDNPEAAKAFLNFLATPANAERLLEAQGSYSGLTNITVDVGPLSPSYEKYVAPGEISVKPFFDRVYLPNGMWNTIITTTDAVINKQSTSAEAASAMRDQFDTLFGQQ